MMGNLHGSMWAQDSMYIHSDSFNAQNSPVKVSKSKKYFNENPSNQPKQGSYLGNDLGDVLEQVGPMNDKLAQKLQ